MNPVEKYLDLEEDTNQDQPEKIETMVNLEGSRILQFESGLRELYGADEDADSRVCNAVVDEM